MQTIGTGTACFGHQTPVQHDQALGDLRRAARRHACAAEAGRSSQQPTQTGRQGPNPGRNWRQHRALAINRLLLTHE